MSDTSCFKMESNSTLLPSSDRSSRAKTWDDRFINLAQHVSSWSKDPSTRVGAVIVEGRRIVSLGFNGFPSGCDDNPEIYLNRAAKLSRVVHAEANAILFARRSLVDCTIYTWPLPPCSACAGLIIQSGIGRVVAPRPSVLWTDSCETAYQMFGEAGVRVEEYNVGLS